MMMSKNDNRGKKKSVRARRARSKTKKPKYLSLRHQLSSEKNPTQNSDDQENPTSAANHRNHHQLKLFPLHPENADTHEHDDNNMAYLFSSGDGGDTTTLTGLLNSSTTSSSDNVTTHCTTTLSSSVSYPYCGGGGGEEEVALVRTALRNKERDASEERWVCYSEVVEKKPDEEVTSSAVDDDDDDDDRCRRRRRRWRKKRMVDDHDEIQRLDLKLDYQEIMNAWSDRGPLFLHDAEFPQTVPHLYHDFLPHQLTTPSHGVRDYCGGRSVNGMWRVPEMKTTGGEKCNEEEGQLTCHEDQLKLGQREASVLRYKEKRQNRLFAKRIRYEVRKLNAEKRPRVKGRFVKRND